MAESKATCFHSGVDTSGEIPRRYNNDEDWVNENGDDYMFVSAYSQKLLPIQIQAKLTPWLLPKTVTEKSKL